MAIAKSISSLTPYSTTTAPHTRFIAVTIRGLNLWLNSDTSRVMPKNHSADAVSTPVMARKTATADSGDNWETF